MYAVIIKLITGNLCVDTTFNTIISFALVYMPLLFVTTSSVLILIEASDLF